MYLVVERFITLYLASDPSWLTIACDLLPLSPAAATRVCGAPGSGGGGGCGGTENQRHHDTSESLTSFHFSAMHNVVMTLVSYGVLE